MSDERDPSAVHPRFAARARAAAESELAAHIERDQREREQAEAAGMPALRRLIDVAEDDTSQSRVVRRFLLGLYNGPEWPFDLTDLRSLSLHIQHDCLAVLRMDMSPRCEVHQRVEDGEAIWRAWWEREAGLDR